MIDLSSQLLLPRERAGKSFVRLVGGFYGELNYTDSWCVLSQEPGMALHGPNSLDPEGSLTQTLLAPRASISRRLETLDQESMALRGKEDVIKTHSVQ